MPPSMLCFHCNLCRPCEAVLALFKRRPRAVPALVRRALDTMSPNHRRRRRRRFSSVRAVFWPLTSMHSDERGCGAQAPFPSPDTPAASTADAGVLALQGEAEGSGDGGEVEEACRRFEKQVMEMVAEERKVRDLRDVEELLSCWEKLRSPVFVDLVGRFYGELCVDLFSGRDTDVSDASSA